MFCSCGVSALKFMVFGGWDSKLVLGSKPLRSPLFLSGLTGCSTGTRCFFIACVSSYCVCQSAFTCPDLWFGAWCAGTTCSVPSGLCRKQSFDSKETTRATVGSGDPSWLGVLQWWAQGQGAAGVKVWCSGSLLLSETQGNGVWLRGV